MTLHRFTRSHPYPGQWLAEQAEAYNTDASDCVSCTPWAGVLLGSAAAELQGLLALLGRAAVRASRAEGLESYCSILEKDMKMLDKILLLCRDAEDKAERACAGTDMDSSRETDPARETAPVPETDMDQERTWLAKQTLPVKQIWLAKQTLPGTRCTTLLLHWSLPGCRRRSGKTPIRTCRKKSRLQGAHSGIE